MGRRGRSHHEKDRYTPLGGRIPHLSMGVPTRSVRHSGRSGRRDESVSGNLRGHVPRRFPHLRGWTGRAPPPSDRGRTRLDDQGYLPPGVGIGSIHAGPSLQLFLVPRCRIPRRRRRPRGVLRTVRAGSHAHLCGGAVLGASPTRPVVPCGIERIERDGDRIGRGGVRVAVGGGGFDRGRRHDILRRGDVGGVLRRRGAVRGGVRMGVGGDSESRGGRFGTADVVR
mmetsp:Transcript_55372/g.165951  ORF Transcript_55372/g.165951 Transcript_55372/m.165951 type:complete len:226 (+) Transcript_55372:702-1379(+)